MKASLYLEAAERLQWPCDRMPSQVGDHGLVLRVLDRALTRMRNVSLVPCCRRDESSRGVVCGTEL